MIKHRDNTCPRCDAPFMKGYWELTDEQKFLIERLSKSAEFPPEQRKKHLFCTRCWFETGDDQMVDV